MKTLSIIACIVALLATSLAAQPSNDKPREQVPTLTVTGEAEVSTRPDEAVVRLGAVAQAPQASAAQQQVNEIMTRAIEDIRRLGIVEDAITTVGVSLQPIYSQPQPRPTDQIPPEPKITGYRASNSVRVRLSDLKKVGEVIDAGIEAGANQIEELSFGLKDDTAARSVALQDAARQAKAKADAIAEAMNLKIDGVLEISEGGVQIMPKYYAGARLAMADAATPVQPGQVQVNATVTVTYRISPR
jgi:hypothetical protein